MIRDYIDKALQEAHYEPIRDDELFYGEVKELKGVWATGKTLEECRQNLADVIDGWVLVRLLRSLPISEIDGARIQSPQEVSVG